MNTQNHPHSQMRVRMIFYFSIRSVIRCLPPIESRFSYILALKKLPSSNSMGVAFHLQFRIMSK